MIESLEPVILAELDALDFDLVELRRGGSRSRPVVEVRVERRDLTKVTLEDCARVSRALEARLDGEDAVPGRYVLEVSSPGADRPLRHADDWRRFIGRHATVWHPALDGGRQEVELLALTGDTGAEIVEVKDAKGRIHPLALADVTKARLAFHWKR